MATLLSSATATEVVASSGTPGSAPASGTAGYASNTDGGGIRTFVEKTGTCTLRMYTRPIGTGEWFRGSSIALAGSVRESCDWTAGEGTEVYFVVEAIGSGNVAVTAMGYNV